MHNRPTEAAIINNFTSNAQNTHTTAVTNSVGVAILHLLKQYFKEERNEANIEKRYNNCLKDMKSFADKADRKTALDILILKAAERLSEYDIVHLYLAREDGQYSTVKLTVPLMMVVPLVWTALKDNDKFIHNYQGDTAEQFAQARGDYNKRVNDFFNMLIENSNNQLCHTGFRNESVFLLNKTYLGIEIIEDARSTIAATLKDHANTLFWEYYKSAQTPAAKKILTSALFTWMSDYNPAPLLMIVDPDDTALEKLSTLFIRHGSRPKEIGVAAHIQSCLPTLNFSYDPQQYPAIKVIENIFDSANEINSDLIQTALNKLQKWIMHHVMIDDEKTVENINAVFTLYQAKKTFDQRMQLLLKASGDMHENFNELSNYCHSYFTSIINTDLENEFPLPDNTFIQYAEQLKASIVNCKSNKMADFIEKFFARWILAVRERNLLAKQYLYRFLLDDIFQEKVILKDDEIDALWKQDDSIFRDITVYQINRVFLHAHMVENKLWTEKFRLLITRVYDCVFDDIRSRRGLPHHSLIASSYVPEMLVSLKYIIEDARDPDRHEVDIYLPHHINNEYRWRRMTQLLSEEKHLEIYEPQAVKINSMILKYLEGCLDIDLYEVLVLIPEKYRYAFMYAFMQYDGFKCLIGNETHAANIPLLRVNNNILRLDKKNITGAEAAVNELIPQEQRFCVRLTHSQ